MTSERLFWCVRETKNDDGTPSDMLELVVWNADFVVDVRYDKIEVCLHSYLYVNYPGAEKAPFISKIVSEQP